MILGKMEKNPISFVRNGGTKLPIGYRFSPTDDELVGHYLYRKAHSLPFPAHVIPELNVFQTNPTDLPGDSREKRFFFWKRRGKWKKSRGMTESGYWKATGKEKHVVGSASNQAIGVKKSFVFHEGSHGSGLRTQWVMREYRLTRPNSVHQRSVREMEDWVVCQISQKKRKSKKADEMIAKSEKIWTVGSEIRATVMEIMRADMNEDSGPPPASCSSGVSCQGGGGGAAAADQDDEITSANINFFA